MTDSFCLHVRTGNRTGNFIVDATELADDEYDESKFRDRGNETAGEGARLASKAASERG